MKNLSIICLFFLGSSSLYAECPVLHLASGSTITVKKRPFFRVFSVQSEKMDLGKVVRKGNTYTWFNADGVEMATASKDLVEHCGPYFPRVYPEGKN